MYSTDLAVRQSRSTSDWSCKKVNMTRESPITMTGIDFVVCWYILPVMLSSRSSLHLIACVSKWIWPKLTIVMIVVDFVVCWCIKQFLRSSRADPRWVARKRKWIWPGNHQSQWKTSTLSSADLFCRPCGQVEPMTLDCANKQRPPVAVMYINYVVRWYILDCFCLV